MKIEELRGKTLDQLKSLLLDLKKEALNLRFQKVTAELTNVSRIRQVRRSIAQLKTVLRELEIKAKKGEKNA